MVLRRNVRKQSAFKKLM